MLNQILTWLHHHWIRLIIDFLALDNAVVAGCHAAGLNKLETIFTTLGKFVRAFLNALINRGANNEKTAVSSDAVKPADVGKS